MDEEARRDDGLEIAWRGAMNNSCNLRDRSHM